MPSDTSAGLPDAESKVNGKVESEAATDVATAKNDELKGQKDQGSSRAQRDASAADAAAGYGTRSRNRTSQHRPNYAEDKDIENDLYDFYHDGKDGDAKKSARGNGELTRSAASTRKSAAFAAATTTTTTVAAASDEVKTATQANGAKETANSVTNTAQPAGPSQPTRKRKAAAAAANTQQSNGSTHVATRRAGNASQTATAANATSWADTNLLTFETCKGRPDNGRMVADDGTVLAANDHVYLVCEPPGEPYYLGRIMEFLHAQNDTKRPVDALRINWYYRPKDIGRKVTDTRLVFATMHSDISPLTALRGKCQIRHRVEIANMDEYRKTPDSFWYEKLYDRYIQKNYDLIPTTSIVNVPDRVKKVLDERWNYVLVEQGRGKELTSAVKLCKRCSNYCASNDSVDCAVCKYTYHMNCVKPPLLKKPSRGFAWSCAACSRAQEKKLEKRHTPRIYDQDQRVEVEDEEMHEEEEEEDVHAMDTERNTPTDGDEHHQGTAEQIYQASLWPYRYLGMHCKPDDALDYDDRIYPRASTRIGPRHQANVAAWTGEPPTYQSESKKFGKGGEGERGRRGKAKKGAQESGLVYIERGLDEADAGDKKATSTLLWQPEKEETEDPKVVEYMLEAHKMTSELDLPDRSTNLQDIALSTLPLQDYKTDKALKELRKTDRPVFKEPKPTPAELKRFEEGVEKYGSELHLVMKHVKTMTPGMIVRFYYTWKKTARGVAVRSQLSGRKNHKKEAKRVEEAASKLADDVADPDDDSAFDSNKATEKKRSFMCQFCSTTSSRQWRRAPNATSALVNEDGVKTTSKDKGPQFVVALCRRCAELWRRYAIRWEDMDDVAKKVAQSGGKAWKRKQDEELLKELQVAKDLGLATPDRAATPLNGTPASNAQEPPRKKLKGAAEKDPDVVQSDGGSASGASVAKKKDKVIDAPIMPEMPKPRVLPCAVCGEKESSPPAGSFSQLVSCRECRLTVHRHCYGIMEQRVPGKWLCDMCTNDKNPQVSIQYKCVLCTVEYTEQEFIEQPKLTHHKKKMSDKDREREKMEVHQARKAAEQYKKKQEELSRPTNPREPLKRTADNNWVHVTCAVWTPEVKFGNARALEPSEGIPSIPRARYDEPCQVCNDTRGATIGCHQCRLNFHVECARQHGHVLGFELTPVKGSRREQSDMVTVDSVDGVLSAKLWCKNHVPNKTGVLYMNTFVENADLNILQMYVQTYKQADLALTGTVRKANLMAAAAKLSGLPTQSLARRQSTIPSANAAVKIEAGGDSNGSSVPTGSCICISCGIDVSPKWWPIAQSHEQELTNGHHGAIGSEAQKFVEQRKFQCHKCRKTNRTPKPQVGPAPPPPPSVPAEGPRDVQMADPLEAVRVLSPPRHTGARLPPPDPRDVRPVSRSWATHPHDAAAAAAAAAQQHGHVGREFPNGPTSSMPPRSGFVAAGYPPEPPPPTSHHDWPHRPASQHGSPLGGPTAPLHGGPPPLAGLGPLRPPPISGLLPPGPITGPGHPNIAPQPYGNGMPPSPRRHASGPTPPSPYMGPYAVGSSHVPAPPPSRNGPLSHPAAAPPPSRSEGYPSALPPQRAAYPAPHTSPPIARAGVLSHEPGRGPPPGRHASPPGSRNGVPIGYDPFGVPPVSRYPPNNGVPIGHDPFGVPPVRRASPPLSRPPAHMDRELASAPAASLPPAAAQPPRPAEGRPASGASASPSLRNLLS